MIRHLQKSAITHLPASMRVYAHWYFDRCGTIQKLHHQLKYGNRPLYGVFLGRLMGYGLRQTNALPSQPDVIVPIPLHKKRRLERGYNQSAILAQGASEELKIPMSEELLLRFRATQPQTGLTSQQRQTNVASAFDIRNSHLVKGKHVLLIDDVLTTGSTLLSASRVLNEAGAQSTSIAALAFTRP